MGESLRVAAIERLALALGGDLLVAERVWQQVLLAMRDADSDEDPGRWRSLCLEALGAHERSEFFAVKVVMDYLMTGECVDDDNGYA